MNLEQIDDVLVIELPARLDAIGVAAIEGQLAEAASAHKGKVCWPISARSPSSRASPSVCC